MSRVRSICWQELNEIFKCAKWKSKIKSSLVDDSILDACGSSHSGESVKKMRRGRLRCLVLGEQSHRLHQASEDREKIKMGSEDEDGHRI